MTKIKLCGLSRPADILTANELEADYIGFVFVPSSKRCISFEKAAELKKLLSPSIRAVGVFADEKPEVIENLRRRGVIDIPQLHGSESEDAIRRLQKRTGAPVLKAFRIETTEDIKRALESPADRILLDAEPGTGERFDWDLIRDISRPWFLAGGLTPENAAGAVRRLHPYAVDVSSGIETDGRKDPGKMRRFVEAVRKVR